MTRMNVGLELSFVMLLLSSWKIYICTFYGMVYQQIAGIPNGQTVFHSKLTYFYIVMRGIICQTFRNQKDLTS